MLHTWSSTPLRFTPSTSRKRFLFNASTQGWCCHAHSVFVWHQNFVAKTFCCWLQKQKFSLWDNCCAEPPIRKRSGTWFIQVQDKGLCFKTFCCQTVFLTNFDDFETGTPVVQFIKGLTCLCVPGRPGRLRDEKFKIKKKILRSNRGSGEMESAGGTTTSIIGYHHIWFRSSEKVPIVRSLEDGLEFHVAARVRSWMGAVHMAGAMQG